MPTLLLWRQYGPSGPQDVAHSFDGIFSRSPTLRLFVSAISFLGMGPQPHLITYYSILATIPFPIPPNAMSAILTAAL